MTTGWNNERDRALKNWRGQGLSFSETAAKINYQFKTSYSRNAVIGRAMRLGLSETKAQVSLRRAKAAVKREEHKRQQEADPLFVPPQPTRRPRRRYRVLPEPQAAIAPPIAPNPLPVGSIASGVIRGIKNKTGQIKQFGEIDTRPIRCDVVMDPKHLSINDLTEETCRWPIGGWPDTTPITFCGHWCPKDEPYCDGHQALARRHSHNVSEEGRAIHSAVGARTNGNAKRSGPFDFSEVADFGA